MRPDIEGQAPDRSPTTVAGLAGQLAGADRAVRDAKKKVHAYVVVDGTLIPIDRVAAVRPF